MLPERYNITNVFRAVRNPRLIGKEINDVYRRRKKSAHKILIKDKFEEKYGGETNIMEEDWDNMILLDACRYDIFKEVNFIDGELDYIVSAGAKSSEFMQNTFEGKRFHDTVYVTANAHIEDVSDETFHKVIKTYAGYDETYRRGWDPVLVRSEAEQAAEDYPNKRLLVHFMQPHYPYIGEKAEQLRNELVDKHGFMFAFTNEMKGDVDSSQDAELNSLMDAAMQGYITPEQLREVYAENIELVLEEVQELLKSLNGKTVISADHGELLGDSNTPLLPKQYSHTSEVYAPELRNVPWLVINTGERRKITSEPPIGEEIADEQEIQQNLRELGYL